VGFHAGQINGATWTADLLFEHFIRLRIELPALEPARQDIHGLVVKMIMDGNLAAGLNRKISQPVIRTAVAVVSVF
jgi:hypothetical protein